MRTFGCFQQVMSPVAPLLRYTVEIANCENLSYTPQFILVEGGLTPTGCWFNSAFAQYIFTTLLLTAVYIAGVC